MVAAPEQAVAALPLLSADERRQVLYEWNATRADLGPPACLHELFEQQATLSPEAVAVIFNEERVTYGELNDRAQRLAHYLRARGVGPEVTVGVMMERSVQMIVALLAILKAGGAYVPLDPQYPHERIAFMLEDAQAGLLLTQTTLLDHLPAHHAVVVCLDAQWSEIAAHPCEKLNRLTTEQNLAYVIYTSGSTGTPKGVAIEHHSVVTLLHWAREVYDPEQLSGVLASTSICFDLSVYELFVPLSWGGRVILAENVLSLTEMKAAAEVRLVNTVPSAMTELVRLGCVPAGVQTVNLAGETLPRTLVQSLYELPQIERVCNLYGPSEDTTYSTYELVERADSGAPSIGRPLTNTEVYLLDQHLKPVPVGMTGELYIGGEGLARGYLNRPDLTAARFIPHPFSSRAGARLYRTGDLARYKRDGVLEFLGRIDQQVKIRGFRIELGEIEARLSTHPRVREAVVIAREDQAGEKRLVAYAVADAQESFDAQELRRFLRESLPEYMIPSAFVQMAALPVTPNGKLDRRALPVPEYSGGADRVAPHTAIEELMTDIWRSALKIERVSVTDNFFELGGHSLLAMRLISRIRETFKVELPLRAVFESPTVTALAQVVEAALKGAQPLPLPSIKPVPRDGLLPLSYAQQRLWFLEQLETEAHPYNIPGAVRLSGQLDVNALELSLNEIIRRHEVLRTTFVVHENEPWQHIAPSLTLKLPVVNLTRLTEADREIEARRFLIQQAEQPFDLARGPLLRAALLKLDNDEHVLLVNMHHIIFDGWSITILIKELAALYEAYTHARPSPLAALPIQYADFAVWQRRSMEAGALEAQLEYWRQQLENSPALLALPTDYPRPPMQTFNGATLPFHLSPELSDALNALSQREGVTLFMTLLAAFSALLHRYAGQEEVAVGTPIAGRTRGEVENLLGCFINTLVLRADLTGDPTFKQLLQRIKETTLAAYAHQDLPFEKLVEEIKPGRNLSYTPLFQVMLILQNTPSAEFKLPEVSLSPFELPNRTAKFDLTLSLEETAQGLAGTLEYNTDLFEAETITRLREHLRVLLHSVVDDTSQRVSTLPLLTEDEKRRVLVEWNDTKREYPADVSLHGLFEEQVARTPEATALIFEDEQLTYRELNERTNRLAHHLQSLGVGPEMPVGILMERSVEMVVALLGVLKAGAAYVPLDPAYPQERVSFMLEDLGVTILLTQERLVESLPPHSAQVVRLDADWTVIAQQSSENVTSAVSAQNLAYIIYTSGSTGTPKGVAISHSSAATLLYWAQEFFSPAEFATTLAATSICFDLSIFEIFVPLSCGARILLVENALALATLSETHNLSLINTVPSAMTELVRLRAIPQTVRCVNLAGEPLKKAMVEAIYEVQPAVERVVNLYGPSEDTTYSTVAEAERGANEEPTIGVPIANTQAYLLDAGMEMVPVGVAGELYLGGAGLARGYLNRAELTAERFVPDPYGRGAGGRLYVTGDLARYKADGRLEYLGRIDHQVKVRGFRIELGEIETTLAQHEDVRDVVLTAQADAAGDNRLVAYVVVEGDPDSVIASLRAFLAKRLPDYMIPSAFMPLAALPLTANGKVDRRALPMPGPARPQLLSQFVAPQTEDEAMLADIWSDLLRLERVGVHDNFFELGGHSLLAIQVISRARAALHLELPLRTLLEHPTIAELAEQIATLRWVAEGMNASAQTVMIVEGREIGEL
jgi:amino acid adenylation domain-containing protein